MYAIKVTTEMGRGLYATEYIKAGDVITVCELLVLSSDDTLKVNDTDLKYYTFKYNDSQDCLVLGDGELFNHADSMPDDYIVGDVENVSYSLITRHNRPVMEFRAKLDIQAGNQLFIDYAADVEAFKALRGTDCQSDNADTRIETLDYIKQSSLME